MKTPILGSSYVARSVNAADNRLVNLFPEIVPEGGKEPAFFQRVPGLASPTYSLADVNPLDSGPIRGMYAFNNQPFTSSKMIIVSDQYVYKLESNTVTLIGGAFITGGSSLVSMADNGDQLFISVNNVSGAIYDAFVYDLTTDTYVQVSDVDFPGSGTVTYLDGFFVFNEPNTNRIWVTGLRDGLSIDPLDFSSAESCPDNVVAVISNYQELWVFGQVTTEVWYNAGLPGFPFAPISGAAVEVGCAAINSVVKLDNSVFFLGKDKSGANIIYRTKGYGVERVSTHSIEWQIQRYGDTYDAEAYTYQQDGHTFYVITFPNTSGTSHTWAYDVATQSWHERAGTVAGEFVREDARCAVYFDESTSVSHILVGDYANPYIYTLSLSSYYDVRGAQKWLRSWRALPPGENNLKRTIHDSLQIDCETGVGDGTTPNPQMALRWSNDGGHTWNNPRYASMGLEVGMAPNVYSTRVKFNRLGMTTPGRDRVYEISGTDPVKVYIMGAELTIRPTDA